jgi:hypothetical protein
VASTGTFSINGMEIQTPSEHGWVERQDLGITGDGHPVYPAIRQYKMSWSLMPPNDYNNLQTYYESIKLTGTVVVGIPQYGASTYEFYNYSGCVISEPTYRGYFSENYTDVTLIVNNIRT